MMTQLSVSIDFAQTQATYPRSVADMQPEGAEATNCLPVLVND
jgi:hypothetical protein